MNKKKPAPGAIRVTGYGTSISLNYTSKSLPLETHDAYTSTKSQVQLYASGASLPLGG